MKNKKIENDFENEKREKKIIENENKSLRKQLKKKERQKEIWLGKILKEMIKIPF